MSKISVDVHDVIANESHSWLWEWYGYKGVFSLESVKKLLSENAGVGEFTFNFHCDGGEVDEGLAIYDALRTSGKKIHCNVEGKCHSMAVTLLLAAPAEYRTANPNALFLIHEVQGGAYGSTSAVEAAAEEQRKMQDAILDIYAERTGKERAALESMMKEERTHTAAEMLEMGFISSINAYNTNLKSTNMNIIEKMRNLLSECEKEETNVAPSEEVENLKSELNTMKATNETLTNEKSELSGKVEALNAEKAELEGKLNAAVADTEAANAKLTEANETIANLNAEVADLKEKLTRSNFVPGGRQSNAATDNKQKGGINKDDIREKLKH